MDELAAPTEDAATNPNDPAMNVADSARTHLIE